MLLTLFDVSFPELDRVQGRQGCIKELFGEENVLDPITESLSNPVAGNEFTTFTTKNGLCPTPSRFEIPGWPLLDDVRSHWYIALQIRAIFALEILVIVGIVL